MVNSGKKNKSNDKINLKVGIVYVKFIYHKDLTEAQQNKICV